MTLPKSELDKFTPNRKDQEFEVILLLSKMFYDQRGNQQRQ